MDKPNPLSQFLASAEGGHMERLLVRGKQLRRLSNFVLNHLDPDLREHCRVINLTDGVLHIGAENNAWATRLRYQTTMLLKLLREDERLRHIEGLRVRVIPVARPRPKLPRRVNAMSKEAAQCVFQCADSIADERLSHALRQLAQRGKQNRSS